MGAIRALGTPRRHVQEWPPSPAIVTDRDAKVLRLEARIAELEAENAGLREEIDDWKSGRARKRANAENQQRFRDRQREKKLKAEARRARRAARLALLADGGSASRETAETPGGQSPAQDAASS